MVFGVATRPGWSLVDLVPEMAQARQLGCTILDEIEDIYSHVAPEVEQRLLAELQQGWESVLSSLVRRTKAWAGKLATDVESPLAVARKPA